MGWLPVRLRQPFGSRPGPARLALATLLLLGVGSADAVIVGGGGGAGTDCLTVLDAPVNMPEGHPKHVRCTDGDSCDADGVVNGVCEFPVRVCANSTFDPRCTLAGVESITVEHADDNDADDTRFDPEMLAIQNAIEGGISPPTADPDECSVVVDLHVAVSGPLDGVCRRAQKLLRITTESEFMAGHRYTDRDKMKFTCDPSPTCDPAVYFTGTFDRIQRQIFNTSCARTPCHVSNWSFMAGFLVLETGTAHGALVGVDPTQPEAALAGWKRVAAGDLTTSLLYHKINRSTLPANFGDPMPRGKPRLDQDLIDIVQLWIEAGAPALGWVPGTDQ